MHAHIPEVGRLWQRSLQERGVRIGLYFWIGVCSWSGRLVRSSHISPTPPTTVRREPRLTEGWQGRGKGGQLCLSVHLESPVRPIDEENTEHDHMHSQETGALFLKKRRKERQRTTNVFCNNWKRSRLHEEDTGTEEEEKLRVNKSLF